MCVCILTILLLRRVIYGMKDIIFLFLEVFNVCDCWWSLKLCKIILKYKKELADKVDIAYLCTTECSISCYYCFISLSM